MLLFCTCRWLHFPQTISLSIAPPIPSSPSLSLIILSVYTLHISFRPHPYFRYLLPLVPSLPIPYPTPSYSTFYPIPPFIPPTPYPIPPFIPSTPYPIPFIEPSDGILKGRVVGIIRRNWRQYAGSLDSGVNGDKDEG